MMIDRHPGERDGSSFLHVLKTQLGGRWGPK